MRKTATVLASLAVGLASIAAAPLATAVSGDVRFTNLTTADGLGANNVYSLYVTGSTLYVATSGGLSISTDGGSTFCHDCGNAVIVRDWYRLLNYRLNEHGHCRECTMPAAGHYEAVDIRKAFGPQRIPVRLAPP